MKKWKLLKNNTVTQHITVIRDNRITVLSEKHRMKWNMLQNSHTLIFSSAVKERETLWYFIIPNSANQSLASSFTIYILHVDWLWNTQKSANCEALKLTK